MGKQGEVEYVGRLTEAELRHAINKPFSDSACDVYLMELGAIMTLLPPPPAHLLDVGCGTGWTSLFFARRGGVKGGYHYGATDKHGIAAVQDRKRCTSTTCTPRCATCSGLDWDHEKLTYRYSDRDFRLTGLAGVVAKGVIG